MADRKSDKDNGHNNNNSKVNQTLSSKSSNSQTPSPVIKFNKAVSKDSIIDPSKTCKSKVHTESAEYLSLKNENSRLKHDLAESTNSIEERDVIIKNKDSKIEALKKDLEVVNRNLIDANVYLGEL
jgi:hypothetical protein